MSRRRSEILGAPGAKSAPPTNNRCRGTIVKTGKPCGATASSSGWCFFHDPTVTDVLRNAVRARGQRAAAQMRLPTKFTPADFKTADSARRLLQEVSDQSRRGQLPVSVAKVVIAAVSAAARLGELALQERVLELEKQLKASDPQPHRRRRS